MKYSQLAFIQKNKLSILVVSITVILTFVLNYSIEKRFQQLGVYTQYDVIFNADPNKRLATFSHGYDSGGKGLVHAGLSYYFNPIIRIIAKSVKVLGISNRDERQIRVDLGLLVVPIISAIKVLLFYIIFFSIGFGLFKAALASTLGAISFTQLIFGSLPEHFALSGFGLLVFVLLMINVLNGNGKIHWPSWVIIGILATGITISNVIIASIALYTSMYYSGKNKIQALWVSLAFTFVISLTTVAGFSVVHQVYDSFKQPETNISELENQTAIDSAISEDVNWFSNWFESEVVAKAFSYPVAVANTISPASIEVLPNRYQERPDAKFGYQFSLEGSPGLFSKDNLLGLMCFFIIFAGALCWLLQRDPMLKAIGVFSIAILGYNGMLHAIWGEEYFLYSQHWHGTLILLISGVLCYKKIPAVFPVLLFGFFLFAIVINNTMHLQYIFNTLEATVK